jgi:hypothetical protein
VIFLLEESLPAAAGHSPELQACLLGIRIRVETLGGRVQGLEFRVWVRD